MGFNSGFKGLKAKMKQRIDYLLHLDMFKMQIIIFIIIIVIIIITIHYAFRSQLAFIFPLRPLHPRRKVFISHDKNAEALQSWYDCGSLDGILPFLGNKFMFCSHVNAPPVLAAICFGILINFCLISFEMCLSTKYLSNKTNTMT